MGIMENNRYNNSKIYKMVDQVNGYFYIGSTCNPLSKRLYRHKCDAKKHPEQKNYKYFNEIGFDNVKIVLIEEHYLENREQLIREEDKVIQMYLHDEKCLNSIRAFVTPEEARAKYGEQRKIRYQEHKEEELATNKKYRDLNRDAIIQQKRMAYKNNRTELLEQQKKYYKDHIDEIHERRNKQLLCACGEAYSYSNKKRHERCKKHQAFLNDEKRTAETI